MLIIKTSLRYKPEQEYIIDVIFGEFLGLDYIIEQHADNEYCITCNDGKKLILPDIFFQTPSKNWLKKNSLPKQPLSISFFYDKDLSGILVADRLPIIFGSNQEKRIFLSESGETIHLPIDILGSAFFMLTRYEEVVKSDRDKHGRFPCSASLAFQEGFLDRPIINEYVEVLWWVLKRLWPGLIRKKRDFVVVPTHDVDVPCYYYFLNFDKLSRMILNCFLDDWSVKNALDTFLLWKKVRSGRVKDPFDTFDLILEIEEKAGRRAAFYFMSGGKSSFDFFYPLSHPFLREKIFFILAKGHEVGFHPSYITGFDRKSWWEEWKKFRSILPAISIHGGRQHYLRFKVPDTWNFWNEAGFEYDATLTYPERPGFRCGVCYPYSVFDLHSRRRLKLQEKPTILMECSLLDVPYMGLGPGEEAFNIVDDLKEKCRKFSGEFVFLWHNNRFLDEREIELFQFVIQ